MAVPEDIRKEAERQQRQRDAIVAVALAGYRSVGLRLRVGILNAARTNQPIQPIIDQTLNAYASPMADATLAAYMAGRTRTAVAASPTRTVKRAAIADTAIDEVVAVGALAALATLASATLLRDVGKPLAERITQAIASPDFQLTPPMKRMSVLREAMDGAGITNERPFLIETVVQDQSKAAFMQGQKDAAQILANPRGTDLRFNAPSPSTIETLPRGTAVEFTQPTPAPRPDSPPPEDEPPTKVSTLKGWMYVTQRDERVRASHAALDGEIAEPDDEAKLAAFQEKLEEWNCRCELVPVYEDQPA